MTCESCGKRCAAELCDTCRTSGVEWAIGWVRALATKGLTIYTIAELVGATPMSVHRILGAQREQVA